MNKHSDICLDYLGRHRWGVVIDGELYKEFDTFGEAADEYEALGGIYVIDDV